MTRYTILDLAIGVFLAVVLTPAFLMIGIAKLLWLTLQLAWEFLTLEKTR